MKGSRHMNHSLKALKKILIAIFGVFVIIIGIILLPLPGPGMLVIVAGLLILSTEFDWAKTHLHNAKKRLNDVYKKTKNKHGRDK
ncbi:PGPGW domain-containing protein [Candidatus Parcubacteria bacterium]|nr:PGPGW domain-containing protein [Candidatus Parcubacteria bacterium]